MLRLARELETYFPAKKQQTLTFIKRRFAQFSELLQVEEVDCVIYNSFWFILTFELRARDAFAACTIGKR